MARPLDESTRFVYESWSYDAATAELECRYACAGRSFAERVRFPGATGDLDDRGRAAARLAFLLAGVSYYKALAPAVVDLGEHVETDAELELMRAFYVHGLGEYAYRNDMLQALQGLRLEVRGDLRPAADHAPRADGGAPSRPLVPFGGGIDSVVVVEDVRGAADDVALFVVSPAGRRFDALEGAAAATGLPVVRADRFLDEQVLASAANGFLNGHVPVTGVISALAVLAAVLHGRDAVVMSNERSASAETLVVGDVAVNHQWSKGALFEQFFRGVVDDAVGGVHYSSRLREASELWVAERFALLPQYHREFRSCNRAFAIDPARRVDGWCGECDKCCFIDLVLAPFMAREDLEGVFGGREPLSRPDLLPRFEALVGADESVKPFECVGDVHECQAAVLLASERDDRRDQPVLARLRAEVEARGARELDEARALAREALALADRT